MPRRTEMSRVALRLEQCSSAPQILKSTECGRYQHGPDQHIARGREERDRCLRLLLDPKKYKNTEQGGTLKSHFELAEPVGTEDCAAVLQETSQTGNDELTGNDHR